MRREYFAEGGANHQVGDVLYYTGSKLASVPYTNWVSSMGSPIAICAIPSSHNVYGNGNAGWVGIYSINKDGSRATQRVKMKWGDIADTSLSNYKSVPIWKNNGEEPTTSYYAGDLPSDCYDNVPCNGDEIAKYSGEAFAYIPSPYVNGNRRESYYKLLNGGNALSDFNGKANTEQLASLGNTYEAAYACMHYKETGYGTSNSSEWYLPACGEWGYVLSRLSLINKGIKTVGGVSLSTNNYWWTSTEYSSSEAYCIDPSDYDGNVLKYRKDAGVPCVCAFTSFSL